MEFFIALIVIIVLLKILGVSNEAIALGGLGLIVLIIVGTALMFAFMCISMIFCRRRDAVFTRIGSSRSGRMKVAYYTVDGEEYPCVFPSEMILTDKMYRSDRSGKVLFNKYWNCVYDKWCIITCIVGLLCFGAASVFTLSVIISVLYL